VIRVKNSGNDSSMGMSFRGKGVNPSYTQFLQQVQKERFNASKKTSGGTSQQNNKDSSNKSSSKKNGKKK
jgi:hypothetical protein